MHIAERAKECLAIPRSLVANLSLFGREGWQIPILFANNVQLKGLHRGSIRLRNKKRFGVRIGFGGTEGVTAGEALVLVAKEGSITFEGCANLAEGTVLRVEGGQLTFGEDFNSNKNCHFFCNHSISFGKDCMLGYEVTLRDDDGHTMLGSKGANHAKESYDIAVGNHVWIAANVDVLKGVRIAENSVVATRAVLTRQFETPGLLLGGLPAGKLRGEVTWKQ